MSRQRPNGRNARIHEPEMCEAGKKGMGGMLHLDGGATRDTETERVRGGGSSDRFALSANIPLGPMSTES